jgi:hypothetical protein
MLVTYRVIIRGLSDSAVQRDGNTCWLEMCGVSVRTLRVSTCSFSHRINGKIRSSKVRDRVYPSQFFAIIYKCLNSLRHVFLPTLAISLTARG